MNAANKLSFTFAMALNFAIASVCLGAQNDQAELKRIRYELNQLETQVYALETRDTQIRNKIQELIDESAGTGVVLFLFGVVCALWAQNTRRNPWLWFLLGVFFSIVTVLVLLCKNSHDIHYRKASPKF